MGDTCSTGFYTFNHEVGHNLSARHQRSSNNATDYSDNVGNEIHPYAHGFINTTGTYFRTIMANGSSCSTSSCPRINRFTNPSQTYAGYTLGVSQSDTNNSADNAAAIDNYASTATGYRSTPTSAPSAPASVTVDRLICYGANDVTWGAASGAVQHYQLQTAPAGTSTWTIQYTGMNQYYFLNVGSATSVRVRACNETGCGSYQNGNQTAQYYGYCM